MLVEKSLSNILNGNLHYIIGAADFRVKYLNKQIVYTLLLLLLGLFSLGY